MISGLRVGMLCFLITISGIFFFQENGITLKSFLILLGLSIAYGIFESFTIKRISNSRKK